MNPRDVLFSASQATRDAAESRCQHLEQAIRATALNAAMTALESVQAQGFFWHRTDGSQPDKDTAIRVITTALDAALASLLPTQEEAK